MEQLNYWYIEIDGIDKCGKDTIIQYINYLTNYKFSTNSRGILTQLAYNLKFNRNRIYNINHIGHDFLIVYLYADLEDLKIRHKITNEPKIDIKSDLKLFNETVNILKKDFDIISFNTSKLTPYQIAKKIINYMEKKNENKEII